MYHKSSWLFNANFTKVSGKRLPLTIMFLLICTSFLFIETTKYGEQQLISQMNLEVTDKPNHEKHNHIENNRNHNNQNGVEVNNYKKLLSFRTGPH